MKDDDILPNPDDLLASDDLDTPIPGTAFLGALIPYSGALQLFRDANGHVAGALGTSDEIDADVYQELESPGGSVESSNVNVSVSP